MCLPALQHKKGTEIVHINDERVAVFRQTTKSVYSLPLTQPTLHFHLRCLNYQVMALKLVFHFRIQMVVEEGVLKPKLITQKEISAACLEWAFSGCTREGSCCTNRRCTRVRLNLWCYKECKCGNITRNTRNNSEN